MEITPPAGIKEYLRWIRPDTPGPGYEWWIRAVSKEHIRFKCDDCGTVVWQTKGAGVPETMRCGDPCYGVMTRTPVGEFWEKEEA